jgi:hypothetical protein
LRPDDSNTAATEPATDAPITAADWNRQLARARDDAADSIERARAEWHEARNRVTVAQRELRAAVRAEQTAETTYRAAVARYNELPR